MKKRARRSPIWEVSTEELQKLIDESSTVCDVLRAFGLNPYAGNHRTLLKRIEEENLDLTKFQENHKSFKREAAKGLSAINKIPSSVIFIKNSKYLRGTNLKKRLIDEGLEEKCGICFMLPEWNGRYLSLQLDHINGKNDDNRKSNLRLLCPNCHSQTSTYSGKKKKSAILV